MKAIADYLRQTIYEVLPALQAISDEDASIKPLPQKWSKKEILGHLIDSATNNHHKFVRTMAQPHMEFVGYAQDFWVAGQYYNSRNWEEIVTFWHVYNLHLAHIIESVNPAYLQNTISISGSKPFTLAFIMEDYVEHMKHHLRVILPEANITSKFQNVYNA
ncbi:DinB family protein [Emticicia sp. BO119]|uniref:DinB family protein n=1 Tax=Emticicia sp. BO119 TaxID=2757768 RepID=UPI0015F0B14C|nr:DinB family protein [Emticicia sp. BO119]MBA4852310.1 DinB family protein [Emticicia sp. BO119]